jgi:Acetyltransferase (GNAT) domain
VSGAKREIYAELIADRGEAAVSDQFFRSRPFLDAEGVTHTLRIEALEGAELLSPLIVRRIGSGHPELDATSPYGYPGVAAPAGVQVDPDEVDFAPAGLVSAFIRHTLAEPPPLAAALERNVVQVADPGLPRKQRSSDRNQINRNRRNGYEVRIVPGPGSDAEQRAGFLAAYEQTMRRAGAADRYFFGAAYFDRILEAESSWLALARAVDGAVAAASIAVRSDGYLHYYLSGTSDSHLRDSPMKNVVAALVELTAELGLPLNLGGGIAPGDALEEFKRGFANLEQAWRTSQLVCDRSAYERLRAGRPEDGFFPAYRRPG